MAEGLYEDVIIYKFLKGFIFKKRNKIKNAFFLLEVCIIVIKHPFTNKLLVKILSFVRLTHSVDISFHFSRNTYFLKDITGTGFF